MPKRVIYQDPKRRLLSWLLWVRKPLLLYSKIFPNPMWKSWRLRLLSWMPLIMMCGKRSWKNFTSPLFRRCWRQLPHQDWEFRVFQNSSGSNSSGSNSSGSMHSQAETCLLIRPPLPGSSAQNSMVPARHWTNDVSWLYSRKPGDECAAQPEARIVNIVQPITVPMWRFDAARCSVTQHFRVFITTPCQHGWISWLPSSIAEISRGASSCSFLRRYFSVARIDRLSI